MANWIRVDTAIGARSYVARARRILGVSKPEMVGLLVLLQTALADERPTGELEGFEPELLAEWAGWEGELAAWTQALEVLTESGRLVDWESQQGRRLEYLEKERERKRRTRKPSGDEKPERGTSAEVPRSKRGTSPGTVRTDGTGRDGRDERLDGDGDLRAIPRARDGERPAVAVPSAAQPPEPSTPPSELPGAARELLAAYAGAPEQRRRDVHAQLLSTLTERGAKLERGVFVRAVDLAHLGAACGTVVTQLRQKQLRDPDKAIRVVLQVLRETWPERQAAKERAAIAEADRTRGRATAADVGSVATGILAKVG